MAGGLGEVLRPHGLADSWRVDAVSNPNQMREVIDAARRATGVDSSRLAAARQDQRAMEQVRVASDASALWRETFNADDADAPDGFNEFAQRAIAESAPVETIED